MSDTYLDGGGVMADRPLPAGAWLRFNLGEPNEAVTVHIDGGGLRVVGQYRPLRVERVAENELRIEVTDGRWS